MASTRNGGRGGDPAHWLCEESGRKTRYASRKRALTALNGLRARQPAVRAKPLRVYRCPHCKDWHFTSTSDRAASVRGDRTKGEE